MRTNNLHLVAYNYDRTTLRPQALHPTKAFLLKFAITYSQHFIDDKDFAFQVGCDSKAEANLHSGRVVLNRGVEELFNA